MSARPGTASVFINSRFYCVRGLTSFLTTNSQIEPCSVGLFLCAKTVSTIPSFFFSPPSPHTHEPSRCKLASFPNLSFGLFNYPTPLSANTTPTQKISSSHRKSATVSKQDRLVTTWYEEEFVDEYLRAVNPIVG